MLRRLVIAVAACGCLVQPSSVFASPLEPTGQWVVDYKPDQCLASREYGSSSKPVTLGIRPAADGESYMLLVAANRLGPDYAKEEPGAVNFGQGAIKSWLLEQRDSRSGSDIYRFRISAVDMVQASSASHMTLSPSNAPDIDLQLGSMSALIKSLQTCTTDLERYWNMGGESDGRIATPSKGDVRSLFLTGDYPTEAYDRQQSGTSQFMLLIDESGKVAGCDVIVASGVPTLDGMGCQIIRDRGKFTPALDAKGKPVRSTLVTPPIVWSMVSQSQQQNSPPVEHRWSN